jgi:hypothetical protein
MRGGRRRLLPQAGLRWATCRREGRSVRRQPEVLQHLPHRWAVDEVGHHPPAALTPAALQHVLRRFYANDKSCRRSIKARPTW